MVIFSVSPAFGRNSCTLSAIAHTIHKPSIRMAIGDVAILSILRPGLARKPLLVLGRAHELHVSDAERGCQLVEAHDRRVAPALLEAAYVLLAEARKLRQLLLGQALFLPYPLDVPPDQLAHVHAAEVSG